MGMGFKNENKMMSEINVTPLVDVMLVLLIIFMITTPLMLNDIKLKLPRTKRVSSVNLNNKQVILSITRDGGFFLGKIRVKRSDLVLQITQQLEKFKDIEIPESLVRQELEVITQGIKNDEVEKNKKLNEELAKKRIKIGLILNEIGEKNNLKVNEEEIKKEIEKQIQMMPDQSKQVMDYYKNNAAALQSLRGGIYEDKIIAFIKQKAKSTKKTISIDEAEKIIIDQNKETEKNQMQTQNKSAKKQSKPKLQKISQKKPIKAKKVSKK